MAKGTVKWMVTRIDGKIASVCADYRHLVRMAENVASMPYGSISSIEVETVGMDDLASLSDGIRWDDLFLWGTPFQKGVWKQLYDLTHRPDGSAVRKMREPQGSTCRGACSGPESHSLHNPLPPGRPEGIHRQDPPDPQHRGKDHLQRLGPVPARLDRRRRIRIWPGLEKAGH